MNCNFLFIIVKITQNLGNLGLVPGKTRGISKLSINSDLARASAEGAT